MDRIKLHDKEFVISIPNQKIEESILTVANQLNRDYKERETPLFLPVLNGSFMFTASLLKNIEFQCELSFIKLASYSGTSTTGEVKEIIGLESVVEGRDIIVLEDIVDTGKTVQELYTLLQNRGAKSITICTLLYKPDSYKKEIPIDYVALEIPSQFIVGYGLDYNQLGRELKNIYVLD